MRALLSIVALYNYDHTLFDGMQIPDGLNRRALIDELMMQLAEVNVIISDPVAMKTALMYWSRTRIDVWKHLFETTKYKYNPIWNKVGTYIETETRDLTKVTDATETRDLTGSNDVQVDSKTSAYNSSTMQPVDQVITDQDTTDGGTIDVDNTQTDTGTITRIRKEHGNIGVTTTQQMIKEEREIADYSLYQLIIEEFKTRFCIMVY